MDELSSCRSPEPEAADQDRHRADHGRQPSHVPELGAADEEDWTQQERGQAQDAKETQGSARHSLATSHIRPRRNGKAETQQRNNLDEVERLEEWKEK